MFFNASLHENWSLSVFSPPPVRYWVRHINHVLHFPLPMSTWAHPIEGSSSISGRNCHFCSRSPSLLHPAARKGCISLHSFCLCLMFLFVLARCSFCFCWVSMFASMSVLWRTNFMKGFRLLVSILYHLFLVPSIDVLWDLTKSRLTLNIESTDLGQVCFFFFYCVLACFLCYSRRFVWWFRVTMHTQKTAIGCCS